MNQHLSSEQILDYLQSPQDAGYREWRSHLLTCISCRKKTDDIAKMLTEMPLAIPYIEQQAQGLPDQLLEYLENIEQPASQSALKDFLSNQPQYTRSALQYLLNREISNRDGITQDNNIVAISDYQQQAEIAKDPGNITRLFNVRTPLWLNIPAAIAAAVVIAILINIIPSQQSAMPVIELASYQDNPWLSLKSSQQAPPGIGFFSGAREETRPFTGMRIVMPNEHQLKMSWPAIQDVENYRVEIFAAGAKKDSLAQTTVNSTNVLFSDLILVSKQHYLWKLSGKTIEGKLFEVSGGFVTN